MRFTFIASLVTALLLVPTVRGVDVKYNNYGVFVPEELRFRDGNTNSPFPFLDEFGTPDNIRYQQVFGSSAFVDLPKGGGYITIVFFRADCLATGNRAVVSTTNFNVWFSTTPKGPDELSPIFAEDNIGPDVLKVRSRPGTLAMRNQGCLFHGGTFPLGPRIDLDVPFVYDPTKGNLLMEVHLQATDVPREPFFLDA